MNLEEYINQKKSFSFALSKWGIEGVLERFRQKIARFLYTDKYDLDDYRGSFLMSRLSIEEFKEADLFSDSQLVEISQFDSEIIKHTVKVDVNIYNLTSKKERFVDPEKYWFLYRMPEEAIDRLMLRASLFQLDNSKNL